MLVIFGRRGPVGEVVVAVVAGVGAELLVGRRDPLAVEAGRAVDAARVGLLEQAEPGELALVGASTVRGQERDVLAVDGVARGPGGDDGERVVGEGRGDVLLRGAGRLGHRGIPRPRERSTAPTGRPSERCSAASRAAPPRMLASSSVRSASSSRPVRVAARASVSATGGSRSRGRRRAEPLGLRRRAEVGVDEVHRAVAARGAVAGVEVPAGLRVGDGLEHRLGHAELGRGRGEGSLTAARVVTDGRHLRLGGRAGRQRQAAEDGCGRRERGDRAPTRPVLAGASSGGRVRWGPRRGFVGVVVGVSLNRPFRIPAGVGLHRGPATRPTRSSQHPRPRGLPLETFTEALSRIPPVPRAPSGGWAQDGHHVARKRVRGGGRRCTPARGVRRLRVRTGQRSDPDPAVRRRRVHQRRHGGQRLRHRRRQRHRPCQR